MYAKNLLLYTVGKNIERGVFYLSIFKLQYLYFDSNMIKDWVLLNTELCFNDEE